MSDAKAEVLKIHPHAECRQRIVWNGHAIYTRRGPNATRLSDYENTEEEAWVGALAKIFANALTQ